MNGVCLFISMEALSIEAMRFEFENVKWIYLFFKFKSNDVKFSDKFNEIVHNTSIEQIMPFICVHLQLCLNEFIGIYSFQTKQCTRLLSRYRPLFNFYAKANDFDFISLRTESFC